MLCTYLDANLLSDIQLANTFPLPKPGFLFTLGRFWFDDDLWPVLLDSYPRMHCPERTHGAFLPFCSSFPNIFIVSGLTYRAFVCLELIFYVLSDSGLILPFWVWIYRCPTIVYRECQLCSLSVLGFLQNIKW